MRVKQEYFCIFFRLLCEFGCFICICIIIKFSKTNPFEKHIIDNINIYFNSNTTDVNTNISLYNYDNKKIFLRYLVSDSLCSSILNDFVKYKGSKLSCIFDLNYEKIYKVSLINLIFTAILIFIFVLIFIFNTICKRCNKYLTIFFSFFIFMLYIGRLITSIYLFYYIERGDIEKYYDFLGCKNVNSKYFERFFNVIQIRRASEAFLILIIIEHGTDKIASCFRTYEKGREDRDYY